MVVSKATACLKDERIGLWSTFARTVSMFSSVRTSRGLQFIVINVERKICNTADITYPLLSSLFGKKGTMTTNVEVSPKQTFSVEITD